MQVCGRISVCKSQARRKVLGYWLKVEQPSHDDEVQEDRLESGQAKVCILQDGLPILYDHVERKPWHNVDDPTLVFDDKDEKRTLQGV